MSYKQHQNYMKHSALIGKKLVVHDVLKMYASKFQCFFDAKQWSSLDMTAEQDQIR